MIPLTEHENWMRQALDLAQEAAQAGEIPVCAVVVKDGRIIASARNEREEMCDVSAHAEILALRRAGQALGRWTLTDCTLYVTLEPCPMCAGAIVQARPALVVFGAFDPQMGAMGSVYALHGDPRIRGNVPVIGGVLRAPCQEVLTAFFQRRRAQSEPSSIESKGDLP